MIFIYRQDNLHESQLLAVVQQLNHVVAQLCNTGISGAEVSSISDFGPWDIRQALCYKSGRRDSVNLTIHEVLEKQATQRPDAIAMVSWDGKFTCAELERVADRLASFLVMSASTCPLCTRLLSWPLSRLVLYRLLDLAQSREYRQYIIEKTGVRLALIDTTTRAMYEDLAYPNIEVCPALEQQLLRTAIWSSPRPMCHVNYSDTACILFVHECSGETPGVFIVDHRSSCTTQTAMRQRLGLQEGVRILQASSHASELSLGETVGPLIFSACMCVPSEQSHVEDLGAYMKSAEVNFIHLTSTSARKIIRPRSKVWNTLPWPAASAIAVFS